MRRVTGLPDDQVVAWESKLEAQVVASLQLVMDKIAGRIERIQIASAMPRILVAVATTGPSGDDDPPPMTGELAIPEPVPLPEVIPETPGLPPGQPYVSPDDLASIAPLWQQQVVDQILPLAAQVFLDSAGHVRAQMLDAVAPNVLVSLPGLGSVSAEAYLAQARNTFDQIGDHLWATARAQLSEGFEAGESIPQLGARLRQSAGLSARTGVMVARTQVIEASNAGSIATARASQLTMQKEWIATPDLRTRPTHLAADGQRVDLNEPFLVGGHLADFPADPSLPASERYGCRCTQGYVIPDRAVAEPAGQSALPPAQELAELPGTSGAKSDVLPKAAGAPDELSAPDLVDLPEPTTKVRSSLLKAHTPAELTATWQDQMRAITGRDIIVQLPPDVSVLTMREHAEGVLQMLERFPEARLRKISWFDGAQSANYAQVRRGSATIEFNSRIASIDGRRSYLASLRSDIAGWDDVAGPGIGWSVRGARFPQATSYHEFGHILSIETMPGAKLESRALSLLQRRAAAEGIDADTLAARDISAYAGTDGEELIGEAMTDVMVNGSRASAISREIYDLVAGEYRARGLGVRTSTVEDLVDDADVFPKAAGPRSLSSQTVVQLRALAKERGIAVPVGTRKADLVKALEDSSPTPTGELPGEALETVDGFVARANKIQGSSTVARKLRASVDTELRRQFELSPYAMSTEVAGVRVATPTEWAELGRRGIIREERTHAAYSLDDREIVFSPQWRTAEGLRGARRQFETDHLGWSFPDYDVATADYAAGVLRHEIGHAVSRRFPMVERRTAEGDIFAEEWTAGQRERFINPLADELRVRRPGPGEDIDAWWAESATQRAARSGISGYAGDANIQEAMAELWASYSGRGELATALVQRLGKAMRDEWPSSSPVPVVSPPPIAGRRATMKVGDLRALAKERGIAVPSGARKADLVKALEDSSPAGDVAPTVTPATSAAVPARVLAARAELERIASSPIVREDRLGGTSSYTFRRTTEAGDEYITKDYSRLGSGPTARRDADAEELGSLVMDALDVPTQTVMRLGPERVAVSILRGDQPGFIGPLSTEAKRQVVADTDTGRMLGLGDMLIGNNDRSENWVRLVDGRPASYDLGSAFRAPKLAGAGNGDSPFSDFLLTPTRKSWAPNDMAPADLTLIRQRLEALKPEFDRLGRATWHKQMMARLVEVEKRATGTRVRLPEAAASVRPLDDAVVPSGAFDAARKGVAALRATESVQRVLDRGARARGLDSVRARDRIRLEDAIFDREAGYAGQGFFRVNRALQDARGGQIAEEFASQIEDVDRVIRLGSVQGDVVLYRGVSSPERYLGRPLRPGDEFTEYGYSSTSVDQGHATGFARGRSALDKLGQRPENPAVLRFVAPEGQPAVQISDLEWPGVGEILLPRGTSYRVVADRGMVDGLRQLDVELVPLKSDLAVTARTRQAIIDDRRAVADALGEVFELLDRQASSRALANRAGTIAARTSGQAADDLAPLMHAMEAGDEAQIRTALSDLAQRRGLTEVGAPPAGQDWVPFDAKVHQVAAGETRPQVGAYVRVTRPGYVADVNGETVQLSKATVEPLTQAEAEQVKRQLLRAEARERNRVIEAQRGTARLLAEVDELAAKGASKTVIRERLDPALREAGQAYAGADSAAVDVVSAALDSGDMAKIRAAVTRAGTKAKIKPIGRAGAKTTFDPDTMEGVGGIDITPGAKVTVVRRGSTVPGLTDPLTKAQVTPVRAASTAKTVAKGDFTGLTRVGEQLGSNPGALLEAGDGSRWYIKTATDPAQLRSEKLALDLYREAGLDVPDVVLGRGAEGLGQTQLASRFLDDAVSDLRTRLGEEAYRQQLQEGFAVDAWLGNWDVLGLGLDNVLTTAAGAPIRIEAGGALRFRAQGAAKAFGDEASEFDSMREEGRGAGRAFSGMTPEQLVASAERIRKIAPAKIKALVKKNGLDPELADTLIARREDILRRAEALVGPKPLTPSQYSARLKVAAKGQKALDAVEAGVTGHTPDIPGQPIHTIWRGIDDDEIKSTIDGYIGNDFEVTNGALRQLPLRDYEERLGRELVEDMDRALDESRLTVDAELWRSPGSGRSIFGDPGTWGEDLAGFEWVDPAYSSATAVKRIADRFVKDGGVRLRILAPKGSKALQLSPAKSSLAQYEESAAEAEVLLARGARYRVVRDRGWSDVMHPTLRGLVRVRDLDVEVVVPAKTPPLPWTTK